MSNPEVAFRDCSHCRQYVYDENGEVRMSRGRELPRVKPPPCDTADGCPKGHWSAPVEVQPRHSRLLQLAEMVRETGGMCLSDAERTDDVCAFAVAKVNTVYRSVEQRRLGNMIAAAIVPLTLGATRK